MVRIAHFSDIHITTPPWQVPWRRLACKRLVGWANLALNGRYATFSDAARITAACIDDVLAQKPDHVVFTGDFTGTSLRQEFESAATLLTPLRDSGVASTLIPGNHDVYVKTAVRERLFEEYFGYGLATDLQVSELPPAARDLQPFPLVRFIGNEVALVALRDVRPVAWHDSSGKVGATQLAALRALFESPKLRQRTIILALHYGLRLSNGSPDTPRHGLRDAEELAALATAAGVALIIHGHLHHRFVRPLQAPPAPVLANPGSATWSRGAQAYHLYDIDGGTLRLEARRLHPLEGRFVPWDDAPGAGVLCGTN